MQDDRYEDQLLGIDPLTVQKRQIEFEQQRNQHLEKRFEDLWKTTDRLRVAVKVMTDELESNFAYIKKLETQLSKYGIRGRSIWQEEVLEMRVQLHHEMVNEAIGNNTLEEMLNGVWQDMIIEIMTHVMDRKNRDVIT